MQITLWIKRRGPVYLYMYFPDDKKVGKIEQTDLNFFCGAVKSQRTWKTSSHTLELKGIIYVEI